MKPAELLKERIRITSSNLDVVESILNTNGISFTVNIDAKPRPRPLIGDSFPPKLPCVYVGEKPDRKINIGLRISCIGTSVHSSTHGPRGETFTSQVLNQTPLTKAQLEIARTIPTASTNKKDWTPQQLELFQFVEDDCRRKEALGQVALIIAEMKGQFHKGHPIVRDNKILEHLNAAAGDKVFIHTIFQFLSGNSLHITVLNSDTLSFDHNVFN